MVTVKYRTYMLMTQCQSALALVVNITRILTRETEKHVTAEYCTYMMMRYYDILMYTEDISLHF